MDKTDEITQRVTELWKEQPKDARPKYVPMFYPPLKNDALLFVGLNPSFGKRWSYLKGTEHDDVWKNPRKFFDWNNGYGFEGKIEKSQDIERLARVKYKYYVQNHQEIAERVGYGENWDHVDLFFYRHTDQREFKEKVFVKDTPDVLTLFGRRQLALSKQLISAINPKVIVVVNALAAQIFKCEFDVTFDPGQACCITQERVPVLFTSFTYWQTRNIQRQRKRLIRDLKRILTAEP